MRLSIGFVSISALLLAFSGPTFAATKIVQLYVTGSMYAGPDWEDDHTSAPQWETAADFSLDLNSEKASINSVNFTFSGVSSNSPAVPVDSAPSSIRLTNAFTYPATVALVRPSGCTIGATPVLAANVHFLNNGFAVTTNSTISVTSNARQTYAIRFAAPGNHGSQSGAVSCSTPGSLTYNY